MDPFLDSTEPLEPADAVAALIVTADGRYLLQQRDNQSRILYPGHWGLFGGAIEAGETEAAALCRELDEELGLAVTDSGYFTRFDFDMAFCGRGRLRRVFYEVPIEAAAVGDLRLNEGAGHGLWRARQALAELRLTPYDGFALWLHSSRARLSAGPSAGRRP
jgi:8-oxo-dGTP diphosphatase